MPGGEEIVSVEVWDTGDLECGELLLPLRRTRGSTRRGRGHSADHAPYQRRDGFAGLVSRDGPSHDQVRTTSLLHSTNRRLNVSGKFCVSLTCAKDDTDRTTVAFVVANAALGSGQDTLVFLSTEAVRLAVQGYADDVREAGFCAARNSSTTFSERAGPSMLVLPASRNGGSMRARWSERHPRCGWGKARGVPGWRSAVHQLLNRRWIGGGRSHESGYLASLRHRG